MKIFFLQAGKMVFDSNDVISIPIQMYVKINKIRLKGKATSPTKPYCVKSRTATLTADCISCLKF